LLLLQLAVPAQALFFSAPVPLSSFVTSYGEGLWLWVACFFSAYFFRSGNGAALSRTGFAHNSFVKDPSVFHGFPWKHSFQFSPFYETFPPTRRKTFPPKPLLGLPDKLLTKPEVIASTPSEVTSLRPRTKSHHCVKCSSPQVIFIWVVVTSEVSSWRCRKAAVYLPWPNPRGFGGLPRPCRSTCIRTRVDALLTVSPVAACHYLRPQTHSSFYHRPTSLLSLPLPRVHVHALFVSFTSSSVQGPLLYTIHLCRTLVGMVRPWVPITCFFPHLFPKGPKALLFGAVYLVSPPLTIIHCRGFERPQVQVVFVCGPRIPPSLRNPLFFLLLACVPPRLTHDILLRSYAQEVFLIGGPHSLIRRDTVATLHSTPDPHELSPG